MMTRVPVLVTSLFVVGCADEPASRRLFDDHAPSHGGIAPGVPSLPVDEPPASCIAADAGILRVGTAGRDEVRDVAITREGTILIAGYEHGVTGPGGELMRSRGVVHEIWGELTGIDRVALLDTGHADAFESVAIAAGSDTVWLSGRVAGALEDTQPRGGTDYVIGQLASTGFRAIARGYDSTPEHPRGLAVSAGGFVAIAGHEQRAMLDQSTWVNPFLSTYSSSAANMSLLWHATRRAAHAERYDALAISDDTVVVGGSIADGDEQGMFIADRDHDAGVRWQRKLSADGRDAIAALHVLPDGDIVWAATAFSQLGSEQHGGADIVVGRLDGATGASRWIVQHGTAGDDHAADLAVDRNGRIYVVGDVAGAQGDRDLYMLVLDGTGNDVAHEMWSSNGDDVATSVAVDACGGVAIGGHTDGDLAGTPRGGRDSILVVTRLAGQ